MAGTKQRYRCPPRPGRGLYCATPFVRRAPWGGVRGEPLLGVPRDLVMSGARQTVLGGLDRVRVFWGERSRTARKSPSPEVNLLRGTERLRAARLSRQGDAPGGDLPGRRREGAPGAGSGGVKSTVSPVFFGAEGPLEGSGGLALLASPPPPPARVRPLPSSCVPSQRPCLPPVLPPRVPRQDDQSPDPRRQSPGPVGPARPLPTAAAGDDTGLLTPPPA